jgi:hypothetical protein
MRPILLKNTEKQQLRQLSILWCGGFILHTIFDPVVTYTGVVMLEVGTELNPLMQPWLRSGFRSFLLIHTPLYVFGIIGLATIRWLFQRANGREQLQVYYLSIVVLSAVSFWGILLVLNNLWAIWIGL